MLGNVIVAVPLGELTNSVTHDSAVAMRVACQQAAQRWRLLSGGLLLMLAWHMLRTRLQSIKPARPVTSYIDLIFLDIPHTDTQNLLASH